ncbi:MAG: hypothetical protein C4583_06885 [Anaerolineaceae bacterium]|nr:MAG: hypothetical protein C4583_06885 [Anaerolineaceae bacterium]
MSREFRPELLPRRGEVLSWLAAIGLFVGLFLATDRWGSQSFVYWLFAGLIAFSALSISLGNWMDRRSVIRLDSDGIAFENGVRSVRLTWPEVQNVALIPTRLGKRVQVQGAMLHFTFKTMSESTLSGQQLRTGFADGQEILETVLKECDLQVKAEKNGMVYYARA